MVFEYRNQPYRFLYLTYQLLTTLFLRLPSWILLYILPSRRPKATWTFRRAIWVKLIRHIFDITTLVDQLIPTPDHTTIFPGGDGVWIPPILDEMLTPELKGYADTAGVRSIAIPGYWMYKKGSIVDNRMKPQIGEKLLILFHGGAYTSLSGHPSSPPASIARGLLKHTRHVQRALSLEYRLSTAAPYEPKYCFPAALLDALACYRYAVTQVGFNPEDIIIEGDSAGGNLALALTRYLVENRDDSSLPAPPGSLLLLSPWCDLSDSHDIPGSSGVTFMTDYIGGANIARTRYCKTAFSGVFGAEGMNTNRYISPASIYPGASATFKGYPRTYIVAGGAEKLLDQIRTLRSKMAADGVKVTYAEFPDAVHDHILFHWHEPERTNALKKISDWLE